DVALSMNTTWDTNRALVAVLGAETAGLGVRGAVFVFQSVFSGSDPLKPESRLVQKVITDTPVSAVDITADGEYAVAGTQGGQVYLISIGEALARRGVSNVLPPLRPAQQSLGDGVTDVAIAKFGGGRVFAVGTQGGDVVLFRNDQAPSGSEGAAANEIRRASVTSGTGCSPQLTAPVGSLAFTSYGEQLIVGAKNGLLQYDAGAFAQYGGDVFAPSWCVPFDAAHTGDAGVKATVSGDGKKVFVGTSHFVYGYTNFYHATVNGGQAAQPGIPGGRTQWAVTVTNDGSLFDRLNLTIAGPTDPGWTFDLSNRSLLLFPGRSQTVLVNVTSPATISPGNFSLTFSVNPERDPTNVLSTGLRLDVGQLRRVELRPPAGTLIASAGEENRFPIVVHNGGNAVDRFRVSARIPDPQEQFKSPGSDWAIRVDPSVIDIGGGQDATVNLEVTPQAQRGDTALIELQVAPEVASSGSAGVLDIQQVTVAVEPTFNGDISLADAGRNFQLWPGQSIYVNFTVKNLGNSRDIFSVRNHTDPASAPGWRLQLSDTRFELRTQGAAHTVRMVVTGQLGLQPGDSVRAIVDVYSDGLAKQTPGSDGKVDEQSVTITVVPQPKSKFLGVPGPPEPLLLLGILGLALAARRRRA
ncbi:MAG: hypothetical protein LC624_09480, partial [Halobacteriales archaeon]|nr:hypothetical protein [Halobacteriales archaeon]